MFNSFSRRVSLIALLLMLGAVPALLADAEMPWAETLEDAMAKAEKTGKPLMMDFYTDWWGWCKRLDAETFTDANIIAIAENFVPVKVNPELTEYPLNLETQRKYGVRAFPAVLFVSHDGGLIHKTEGFMTPDQFAPNMEASLAKEAEFAEKLAKIKEMPEDAKLNAEVAITYLERMQIEKAIPFSEKAIQQDPKNRTKLVPKLHNQLGLAYGTLIEGTVMTDPEAAEEHYQKAITHFTAVIEKYPDSISYEPAQYYLGVTHAIKGNFAESIMTLEKLANHATDEEIQRNAAGMLERVKMLRDSNQ